MNCEGKDPHSNYLRKEVVSLSKTDNKETGQHSNKSRLIIIIAIIFIIIIGVLVGIIIKLLKDDSEEKPVQESYGRGTLVTSENAKKLAKDAGEPVADGYYTTSMNVDWYFDDGKAISKNAYVENDISNTRTVYFDLLEAGTGELLYSSPYIPVGAVLEEIALEQELAAGDYDAIVKYHLVDDDLNVISTVSVSVKLHILK